MNESKNTGKKWIISSLVIVVSVSLMFTNSERSKNEGANPVSTIGGDQSSLSGKNAIEYLKESGQYESLGAAYVAARYEADESEGNAFATNHANQIRSSFSPSGLLLESNSANTKWQSRWCLQNLGYGDDQLTIGEADVQTTGNRVTINREISARGESAIVEEWFNNTPEGLEHGFTLPQRLSETAENLRLTIAVDGDLTTRADADGQNLKLVNNQGEVILNYEKLKVWDADGAPIAARMTTEDGLLTLEVEDSSAEYPLTIDPTFSAAAKLTSNDGAIGDFFGTSVAISGDTVIVGASTKNIAGEADRGAAYIFVRGANGLWSQQAGIFAADGAPFDHFGTSVAISGDTAVIGAYEDDIGTNKDQGSAYVYIRMGTTWILQQKIWAGEGSADDLFGFSAAISGDTVIVGAYRDDIGGQISQGSAYAFARSNGVWTQQQKLTASDGAQGDEFGGSVAISANTAIIGARDDDVLGLTDAGSAYVFARGGSTWTQQTQLYAANESYGRFGSSVSISTGFLNFATAAVGAPNADVGGIESKGAVFVFARSGTSWSNQQALFASDGATGDEFGFSVAISGGTIVVGTYRDDSLKGSAYIFTRNISSIWNERQKITAFDGAAGDSFGESVAVSGESAIVGAFRDGIGGNPNQGSAHIYQLGSKPFDFDDDGKTDLAIFRPAPAEWWYLKSSDGGNAAFQFGASSDRIVPADFTGDGKTDVAVWRPATGSWFILRSEDSSFYSFPFGANGDIPSPADFDDDGEADAAVFRPANATWYISLSNGGTFIQQFGANGDVPAIGDYDADGRADIAIWRPSLGQWWIQRSALGTIAFTFGNSADKPVQGDYTGDGKTDVAIFRPSTGEWFVLRSQDQSFYSFPFGANGDIPSPGDYDNDGKFDATVFRPSNSTWYSQRTTAGTLIQQFGQAGDKPVPSAFIP